MKRTIEALLITILINSCGAYAADPRCDTALHTCIAITTEQEAYIKILKGQLKQMEQKAVEADSQGHPAMWAIVGAIATGFVITLVRQVK